MDSPKWIKTFVLTGLLALPSTFATAGVVEMIVTPCTSGTALNKCGIELTVTDAATFTTDKGRIINLPPGTKFSITGAGTVSQSPKTRSILNFATAAYAPDSANSLGPTLGLQTDAIAIPQQATVPATRPINTYQFTLTNPAPLAATQTPPPVIPSPAQSVSP
jgi:hypothetical protein